MKKLYVVSIDEEFEKSRVKAHVRTRKGKLERVKEFERKGEVGEKKSGEKASLEKFEIDGDKLDNWNSKNQAKKLIRILETSGWIKEGYKDVVSDTGSHISLSSPDGYRVNYSRQYDMFSIQTPGGKVWDFYDDNNAGPWHDFIRNLKRRRGSGPSFKTPVWGR